MKKHYLLKGLAFVLTFCLLILLYPIPSHAENAEWKEYTYETTRTDGPPLKYTVLRRDRRTSCCMWTAYLWKKPMQTPK